VHEPVDLLEPTRGARFVALMDRLRPNWQFHRQLLDHLPFNRHTWSY
jgi:hypothetical protein